MGSKPPLLFLAHRVPYPPNKGDKIRSFHLVRHLSQYFRIFLGAFADAPEDAGHWLALREYCADVCLVPLRPPLRKSLGLLALLAGSPLSVAYYRSGAMQRWVDRVVEREKIRRCMVFCSPMSRFVAPARPVHRHLDRIFVDCVDLDSEKWRQYASTSRWPLSWLYRREAQLLLEHEKRTAAFADRIYFVSREEAELFSHRGGASTGRLDHFANGVDTEYFRPAPEVQSPYPPGVPALVFTGAMDYRPNVEAVVDFCSATLPALRAAHPSLQFWIVGARPAPAVRALTKQAGVVVTGRVPDVRPYLQHALAAIAPMRIARGVQNKVLEAFAMGTPVLATREALEGIDLPATALPLPMTATEDYLDGIKRIVVDPESAAASAARCRGAVEALGWEATLRALTDSLLETSAADGADSTSWPLGGGGAQTVNSGTQ